MKARAIRCPYRLSRGDKVSVAQGGTTTPSATKQLLPTNRVLKDLYIYIYIYTPDQLTTNLHCTFIFIFSAVCDF